MLIIDPEVDCARIYTEDYVGLIKGTPQEVCDSIEKRVMAYSPYGYEGELCQAIVPTIVDGGIGTEYIRILEDKGIYVKKIKAKIIDVFFPKLS